MTLNTEKPHNEANDDPEAALLAAVATIVDSADPTPWPAESTEPQRLVIPTPVVPPTVGSDPHGLGAWR